MPLFSHRHVSRRLSAGHPLAGKTVYIPTMAEGSPEAFSAVFHWLGIDAQPTPPSDERTRELGSKYTTGDECYPAKVTVGDFLRVIEMPGFNPARAAFFMPTAEGPCRFGQYAPFLKKILREAGYGDVQVLSPTSQNGYADLGDITNAFLRAGWRALVAADTLHRALLKTRPYETTPGSCGPGLPGVPPGFVPDAGDELRRHGLPAHGSGRVDGAGARDASGASRPTTIPRFR